MSTLNTQKTHAPDKLHKSARSGWMWGAIDQFAQRGLSMIVSLILARILDPKAFGTIASVAIFFTIAAQVIDGGIGMRVLQKTNIQDEDYSALFWCNLLMSIICSATLIAFSGAIANFYSNPQLRLIVMALAVVLFIMNFGRVQENKLRRELRFRTSSLIKIASVLVGCITGILMAVKGFGIWALLGQQASMAFAGSLALWIFVPWRPTQKPSIAAIKDLYGYGIPVLLSQVFRASAGQFINVILAKQISSTVLGYYDRGRVIPQNFGLSMVSIFSRSNFPILSKLQNDETELRDTYIQFLRIRAVAFLLPLVGLAVCADDIILILLGAKWVPSVWFLQASSLSFIFLGLFSANSELLLAKGFSNANFRYNMICAGLQIAGVLAGIPWGAKGMVMGDLLGRALACVPLMVSVGKNSLISIGSQLGALMRPLFGALMLTIILWGVRSLGWQLWPRFVVCVLVGGVASLVFWYTDGFRRIKLKD